MSDQQLLSLLRGLGYSATAIKAISAAAEAVEIESISSRRGDLTQLISPVQAASQSARHAAQLRKFDQTIFHASGCKWRLPTDGSLVDELELNRAIANAAIDSRAAIRAGLYELGLIRR
jgi:hypothetical protein